MNKILLGVFRYHHRLVAAIVIGVVVGCFVPGHWNGIERPLLGWNTGLWSYLFLLWTMMMRTPPASIRELASREDESAKSVLFTVTLATIASIAAIILELATAKGAGGDAQKTLHILFPTITLLGGWLLLPTLFTIHYARLYFAPGSDGPSLQFPDKVIEPDYWDFAYFAFTIAVASQTADVSIASPRVRRVALAQSVVSFFFNLAVLGLSINIAASLLS